jgi:Ca2+-transporting ATPase
MVITGDYSGKAYHFARRTGLGSPHGKSQPYIITDPELDAMRAVELQGQLESTSFFARAIPDHKLRLGQALKANGKAIAMTGKEEMDIMPRPPYRLDETMFGIENSGLS